ncbi:MAG TPA: STAS domain-containing protein [Vicinamibacterales bacterium]|nr:STAS domain-containing protein [Vicinamibacterales bacterium]
MAPHLVITEQRFGAVALVSLNGWLVADDQDAQFRNYIDALVSEGITKIVADLQDVTLLDSGGIGVLVAKFLTLRKRGGDLRLARLTARTQRVLSITRLLTVFATFDSPDSAVHSFATDAPPTSSPGDIAFDSVLRGETL